MAARMGNRRAGERDSARVLAVKFKAVRQGAHGQAYALLASTIDDVERKRHKRNPFDDKYIKLCLSSFQESLPGKREDAAEDREHVESAAANVHVRVELIRTMKQNLVKETANAAKQVSDAHAQEAAPGKAKKGKKNRNAQPVAGLDDGEARAQDACVDKEALAAAELGYEEYLKFKDLNIEIEIPKPGNDPNGLDNAQLCFDPKTECQPQDFEDFLKSLFPEQFEAEERYEDILKTGVEDDFDIKPFIQDVAEQWEPNPLERPSVSKTDVDRFLNLWRDFNWASICPRETVESVSKEEGYSGCSEGGGEALGKQYPDCIRKEATGGQTSWQSGDNADAPLAKQEYSQESHQAMESHEGILHETEDLGMDRTPNSTSQEVMRNTKKTAISAGSVKGDQNPVGQFEVPSCEILMEEYSDQSNRKSQSPSIPTDFGPKKGCRLNHKADRSASIEMLSKTYEQKSVHHGRPKCSDNEGRKGFGGLDLVPCHQEQPDQGAGIFEGGLSDELKTDLPEIFIKPDFSEENLRNMRPDVLFRDPRPKLKYRPVYGAEALCIPPPKLKRVKGQTGMRSQRSTLSGDDEKVHRQFDADHVDLRKGLFWDLDIVAFGDDRVDVDNSMVADAEDPGVVSDSDDSFWDDEAAPDSQEKMKTFDPDVAVSNHGDSKSVGMLRQSNQMDQYDFDVMVFGETPSPHPSQHDRTFQWSKPGSKMSVDQSKRGAQAELRSRKAVVGKTSMDFVSNATILGNQFKEVAPVSRIENSMGIPCETNTPSVVELCTNRSTMIEGEEAEGDFLLPPCHVLFEHTQEEYPLPAEADRFQSNSDTEMETEASLEVMASGGGRSDCNKTWECSSESSVRVSDCDVVMDDEKEENSDNQHCARSGGDPCCMKASTPARVGETPPPPPIIVPTNNHCVEIGVKGIKGTAAGSESEIGDCEVLMCDGFSSGEDQENDRIVAGALAGSNHVGCVGEEFGICASRQYGSPAVDVQLSEALGYCSLGCWEDEIGEGMSGDNDELVADVGDPVHHEQEPWEKDLKRSIASRDASDGNLTLCGDPQINAFCCEKNPCSGKAAEEALSSVSTDERQQSAALPKSEFQTTPRRKPSMASTDHTAVGVHTNQPVTRTKRTRDELCEEMIKEALKEDVKIRMDLGPLMSAVTAALVKDNSSGFLSFGQLLATLRGPMKGEQPSMPVNPQRVLFALLHVAHQNNSRKDTESPFQSQVRLERKDGMDDVNIYTR